MAYNLWYTLRSTHNLNYPVRYGNSPNVYTKKNKIHYKYLLRAIKLINDTEYYLYQMKTDKNINEPWELHRYSDMDYAWDNDTRKTVTGYIILIHRTVIAWHSRIQKKLHYLLQNMNIHKSRRYDRKYYFTVLFYCLWDLLLNIPLTCILITFELISSFTLVLSITYRVADDPVFNCILQLRGYLWYIFLLNNNRQYCIFIMNNFYLLYYP